MSCAREEKRKNPDELIAREWIESQGYTNISDLSECNLDPPDFVVEGRKLQIGVEVMRLNWTNNTGKGAESFEKPLEKAITKTLDDLEFSLEGYNVYMRCCLFGNTLPKNTVTQRQVGEAVNMYFDHLNDVLQSGEDPERRREINLECGIRIDFWPRKISGIGKFKLEPITYPCEGVQVDSTSIDTINRCVAKKTERVQHIADKFPDLWLVLVNRGGFTPAIDDKDDWKSVKDGIVNQGPWSRIVVINWDNGLPHIDLINWESYGEPQCLV